MAHRISRASNRLPRDIPDTMRAAAVDRFGPPSALNAARACSAEPGTARGAHRDRHRRHRELGCLDSRRFVAQARSTTIPPRAGSRRCRSRRSQRRTRPLDPRPGQPVLIFGASGAVGTMAVQFAVQRGAHVLATASGAAPARLVRRLGAHRVIDARRPPGRMKSRHRSSSLPPASASTQSIPSGANLLSCSVDSERLHPNGIEPVPKERRAFRARAFDAVANPREFDKLNRYLRNGRIRVPIAASYSLGKAARAHRRLGREHVLGRMVLCVRRHHQRSVGPAERKPRSFS